MAKEVKISIGEATNGFTIFSQAYIDNLRKADKKHRDPYTIIAQTGGQEKLLTTPADITIYGGNRGGGKMADYKSLVCTPFGFRQLGDLTVGSIITNPVTGAMQRVIQIHEHGMQDVYEITFLDGATARCGLEHLWLVKKTCHQYHKMKKYNNMGQEADWRIMEFKEMIKHMEKHKGKKQPSHLLVPLTKPVKFTVTSKTKVKKVHPYLLGVILGDGCVGPSLVNNNSYCITSADPEVIDNIYKKCGIMHTGERTKENNKAIQYMYELSDIKEQMKYDNLLGCVAITKFIPKRYLYGSVEERFELIKGLMDTDGYIDERGHCSYSTISKQLAEDVQFLVRSLGGTATITQKKAGYRDDNGDFVQCNEAYEIYIRHPQTELLFDLPRRKERCKKFNGGVSEVHNRIVSYRYVGKRQCRCITVDDRNGLYLADNFIVTHNSFGILMDSLNDIENDAFKALILRKEKNDLSDIIETSYSIFSQFGTYNKSKDDMTWNFNSGAFLKFDYYADSIDDFKKRFQGKQFSYIAIDEITHMEYNKFKYIMTDNRNAAFIRNRVIGTCNPDPESWVAKFIDWWIDDEGFPLPDRDGVLRYCFMDGDDTSSIVWGDTRDEVYEKCHGVIDKYWREEYAEYGSPKDMFIKSVCFIQGKLSDNKQLLRSDPSYLANLANQSEESRSRDLDGNWKYKEMGSEIIKLSHMEELYERDRTDFDRTPFASCDIAMEGGDNLVLCLWTGHRTHLQDIFVCRHNSKVSVAVVQAKLKEWGVPDDHFTYDLNGLGQIFKGFFPKAVPFINQGGVEPEYKYVYANIKSQAAYTFSQRIISGELTIEKGLLERKFSGSGYSNMKLKDILLNERKCIRQDPSNTDHGFALPKKKMMKQIVGHSPDFIEAMMMIEIFNIAKKCKVRKGFGFI